MGLTESRDGIDGAEALHQKRVGCELEKLRAPKIGAENPLLRDPVALNRCRTLDGFGILYTDKQAIRCFEIRDGRAFRKELRIGESGEGLR